MESARTMKGTIPFPRVRFRGRGDTADKTRFLSDCACPLWHEGQAGRWHGPCLDAEKPCDWAYPRRLSKTNEIHRASGHRVTRTPKTPIPYGTHVSRTNPVSPRRTSFGRRDAASGDMGPARCPVLEFSRFREGRMSSTAVSLSSWPKVVHVLNALSGALHRVKFDH